MFPCSQCGECCRNLHRSNLYKDLDRGDGICKYLKGNLCSIYENRPVLCRVDAAYKIFFQEKYTLDEFYKLNKQGCEMLKKLHL